MEQEEKNVTQGKPLELPLLPLRDIVVFPHMVVPLFVGREKSISAIENSMLRDKNLLLATQRVPTVDDPGPEDVFTVGTQVEILQIMKLPDSTVGLAFQRVPEGKVGKNRVHVDLHHPDPEALIAKVIDLGGTRLQDHGDESFSWTVLADPEGNEFCVTV